MLALASAASRRIVLVQSRHPKAMPAPDLRAAFDALPAGEGRMVVAAPSMEAAIETAQGMTPSDGYIVGNRFGICGRRTAGRVEWIAPRSLCSG